MAGDAAKLTSDWDLCELYDWRSWTSWRALLTTAVIMGFTGAGAALVAESVVRDFLGMELGGSPFSGPDILAITVAVSILIPCLLIWIRVPTSADGAMADRLTEALKRPGGTRQWPEWFVFPVWMLSVMAVSAVLYVGGVKLIGAAESIRYVVVIWVLPALGMGGASLNAGLRRFDAKPLPSDRTRQ